jgi:hypothetical protein
MRTLSPMLYLSWSGSSQKGVVGEHPAALLNERRTRRRLDPRLDNERTPDISRNRSAAPTIDLLN